MDLWSGGVRSGRGELSGESILEETMTDLYICDEADVDSAVDLCRINGWGIEIQAFYDPVAADDPAQIQRHREAVSGIPRIALHGPFGDLCAGSFDAMVREVAHHRFDLAYDVACEIGATDIVLHHGYVPGAGPPASWVPRFADFWEAFSEGKTGEVRFHLENMLEHGPELVTDVLAAIRQDNVDVCLDIGHAHCNSRTDAIKWIEALGQRIGYVHLHDNHGERDEHLALGEGDIPLVDVCQALQDQAPEATWAIECSPRDTPQSIRWLSEHGFLQ